MDKSLGQASGNALKGAITDAVKRAARHFGEKLGNSLYRDGFSLNKAPVTLKNALDTLDVDRMKVEAAEQQVVEAEQYHPPPVVIIFFHQHILFLLFGAGYFVYHCCCWNYLNRRNHFLNFTTHNDTHYAIAQRWTASTAADTRDNILFYRQWFLPSPPPRPSSSSSSSDDGSRLVFNELNRSSTSSPRHHHILHICC